MAKILIIAEAGVNHNGSLVTAKRLVDAAKSAGADAVKFQTFKAEDIATSGAPKAAYQKKRFSRGSQFEMLKRLELSERSFRTLCRYCSKKEIMFLSTPFDYKSAEFIDDLGVRYFKISSGDLTNIPFLSKVALYKKPIILSTGMSSLAEVSEAVKTIYAKGNRKLILLHCTSNYPTRFEDANLLAIRTLKNRFKVPVGYSDHTLGFEAAIAAAALGAAVIEKHITLDRNMAGPDHKSSLEPEEFGFMVRSIRNTEKALGDGRKTPRRSEFAIRKVCRKSIVTACMIPKGAKITVDMLSVKRPGTGIEPKYFKTIIGRRPRRRLEADRVMRWADV